MPEQFDLVVIGGGPGGVAASIRGIQLGARVALIERDKWGGLCLNKACIPTKFFTTVASRLLDLKATSVLDLAQKEVKVDFERLRRSKQELIDYLSLGTKGLLSSYGVKLISGQGKLVGPGKVLVGQETLEAKAIILATGGEWVEPDFPGADLPGVVVPDELMAEKDLPGRVLVSGGGPWGLELAQFLYATGGSIVIAEPGQNLLPGEDPQIGQRLRRILNNDRLLIHTETKLERVKGNGSCLKATLSGKKGQVIEIDRVLWLKRRPALQGLGLETVGLNRLDVDERMATSVKALFAVGDVTGGPPLSHLSSAQGIVAAENALGGSSKLNLRAVPRVIYTHPQVAWVGLGEAQSKEAGFEPIVGVVPLGVNAMAMIQGQSEGVAGMIKVIGDARYGELLGVQIIGHGASEMIGQAALAIQMEACLLDLARSILPHPSLSESLADAARAALGWALYLPKQTG